MGCKHGRMPTPAQPLASQGIPPNQRSSGVAPGLACMCTSCPRSWVVMANTLRSLKPPTCKGTQECMLGAGHAGHAARGGRTSCPHVLFVRGHARDMGSPRRHASASATPAHPRAPRRSAAQSCRRKRSSGRGPSRGWGPRASTATWGRSRLHGRAAEGRESWRRNGLWRGREAAREQRGHGLPFTGGPRAARPMPGSNRPLCAPAPTRVDVQVEQVLGCVLSDAQVAHRTGGAAARRAHALLNLGKAWGQGQGRAGCM